MMSKIKIYNFIFILIIILAFLYAFFSEKNIVILFKNKNEILKNEVLLEQKKKLKVDLEKKIENFSNSEIYKELILKEKLFLKNRNDKLIFFELDN